MRSCRRFGVTVFLVVVFGFLGAHRFYTGRTVSGVAQAATLGGLGIWWLIDIFVVSSGQFVDRDRRLVRWSSKR